MKKILFSLFLTIATSQIASAQSMTPKASEYKLGALMRLSCIGMSVGLDTESTIRKCSVINESTKQNFMGAQVVPSEAELNSAGNDSITMSISLDAFVATTKTLIKCLLVNGKVNNGFTHQGAMNHCEVSLMDRAGRSSPRLYQEPLTP